MRRISRRLSRFLELALAFLGTVLISCGGEGNPVVPVAIPALVPTQPPVTRLLVQESWDDIIAGYTYTFFFRTNYRGDISSVLDWTFAATRMDLFVVPGVDPCYVDDEPTEHCPAVAISTGFDKPLKASAKDQPAGDYTIYVTNRGLATEAISYQVFLTSFELSPARPASAASPIVVQRRRPLGRGSVPPRR